PSRPPPLPLPTRGRGTRTANALHWADRFRIIQPGGRHGERPDAQQQGKEEAQAGQEQAKRRPRPLAVRRHAQPGEPEHVREEVVSWRTAAMVDIGPIFGPLDVAM